jgi:hypothetical protein
MVGVDQHAVETGSRDCGLQPRLPGFDVGGGKLVFTPEDQTVSHAAALFASTENSFRGVFVRISGPSARTISESPCTK